MCSDVLSVYINDTNIFPNEFIIHKDKTIVKSHKRNIGDGFMKFNTILWIKAS